jgi:hypothetical protein
MTTNKHGLPRHVPVDVAREVRQRCGFGCVICGLAITTYEHFDPLFKDAKVHDPKGITLLCGNHQLHTSKSTSLLSKETIAAADKDPKCKQTGYADHLFDLGGTCPTIVLGSVRFIDCGRVLTVNGKPCISIREPEPGSKKWRLSAEFDDQEGRPLCRIIDNELQIFNELLHDFDQEGNRFSIKGSDGRVLLDLRLEAPHSLYVDAMRLELPGRFFQPVILEIKGGDLLASHMGKHGRVSALEVVNWRYGIEVTQDGMINI